MAERFIKVFEEKEIKEHFLHNIFEIIARRVKHTHIQKLETSQGTSQGLSVKYWQRSGQANVPILI